MTANSIMNQNIPFHKIILCDKSNILSCFFILPQTEALWFFFVVKLQTTTQNAALEEDEARVFI